MPFYPGPGKAQLIQPNSQVYLFNNERIVSSLVKASIALQLARPSKGSPSPFGFAIEAAFNGAPGVFELDVQGAETDQDANYVLVGTAISAVSSSNVARFDATNLYPKYVRLFVKTLTNDVFLTSVLTR